MSAPFGRSAPILRGVRKPDPLTPLQRDCLGVIIEYWADFGRSPSHSEITRELDLRSKSNVNRILRILEEKSWIRRIGGGRHYSIKLLARLPALAEGPVEMTTAGRAFVEARSEMEAHHARS